MDYRHYDSLEQRIADHYRCMLAPFAPSPALAAEPQRAWYAFVQELLERLYANPTILFPNLHEDDAHPNRFNCASYGKPKLKPLMKAEADKIGGLFALVQKIAREGVAAAGLTRPKRALLEALGFSFAGEALAIPAHPEALSGLRYLAERWAQGEPGFARCWFAPDYPYLEKTMARFYDSQGFARLTGWLNERGYRRYEGVQGIQVLDYAKSVAEGETPLGYAMHGDKFHYGFTFETRYEAQVPYHFEPRILRYGEMLKRFGEWSPATQGLILRKTKPCDGCRYCVQTDKSGKRPLAALEVAGQKLCPFYPGFGFAGSALGLAEAEEWIAFLEDMERMLRG